MLRQRRRLTKAARSWSLCPTWVLLDSLFSDSSCSYLFMGVSVFLILEDSLTTDVCMQGVFDAAMHSSCVRGCGSEVIIAPSRITPSAELT